MGDKVTAVVIDNGSFACKAGFSGDKAPKIVFPSKVGYPRERFKGKLELEPTYVGDEAVAKRGVLSLKYPVEQGIITKWEDMEKLWEYTFHKLGVSPEDQPVLLTDTPDNPAANREKMTQIMIETFKTPGMFIGIQGVLSLYAEGLMNGVAIDSGASVTQIVPVKDGNPISNATACLGIGGRDIDDHLTRILVENGVSLTYQTVLEDVRMMKEKFGYVAVDCTEEMASVADNSDFERSYKLVDEQVLKIKNERFQCTEALFEPSLAGKDILGVHRTCCDSITKCDAEVRNDLFANVVLSGGSSMFPGFAERMQKELTTLAPAGSEVNVIASPNRMHNVWIGGSVLTAQPIFKDMWLTKKDYEEHGASIVHKKCV